MQRGFCLPSPPNSIFMAKLDSFRAGSVFAARKYRLDACVAATAVRPGMPCQCELAVTDSVNHSADTTSAMGSNCLFGYCA